MAQEPILQVTNTTENLRGLSVPSARVVWSSGTHGAYVRSVDGGKTWNAAQVPGADGLDFRDVEAFGANLAYLLSAGPGEQSRIYKTTDGGRHWAMQFDNHDPQGFLDCMAFWDRDHGIVLGDPTGGKFTLLETSDGGRHWTMLRNVPSAVEGEGAFAASGSCITSAGKHDVWFATGGSVARVFHSSDRGKRWSIAESPLPHSNPSSGIFSIAFRDATHGVIAGGDYKDPERGNVNVAFTEDGGNVWRQARVTPQAYYSAAAWSRQKPFALMLVGTLGASLLETPETPNWRKSWSINLNSVSFDSTGNAWAAGPLGVVMKFPLLP